MSEIEQVVCKLCDLKDVEVSLVTDGLLTAEDLRESVEKPEVGNIIFGIDRQSIESLLCMHLKIDQPEEGVEPTLTNTHTRLFRKLCAQVSQILMGDNVKLGNADSVTPSMQNISMWISYNNTELAVFNLTLDNQCLNHIRDKLETFPEVDSKRIDKALQQIPVELECEVMNATKSLQHMLNLRVGDFLPMKKQSQTSVKVNGVEMYKGALVAKDNELGVKINEQLR